jgi:hypothetical protein
MKKISILSLIIISIVLSYIAGQKSKQGTIDSLIKAVDYQLEQNNNKIPTQTIVDCWDNERPTSNRIGIDTSTLEAKNYCLVVPADGWDF